MNIPSNVNFIKLNLSRYTTPDSKHRILMQRYQDHQNIYILEVKKCEYKQTLQYTFAFFAQNVIFFARTD